jgi:hypothetical protein
MSLYLGTENVGTKSFSLQDFLPTPITFLRESHAIESASLILGLAVVWLVLLRYTNHPHSAPRSARYAGMALAMAILVAANWLAFQFKWAFAIYFGEALMAQLSPLKQHSMIWDTVAKVANFSYYSILVGLFFLIWLRRETLGRGVLQIISIVKGVNSKV